MRNPGAVALLLLLLLVATARADPAVAQPGPAEGLAQWTFSSPGAYRLANATLRPGEVTLRWSEGSALDTTAADFGSALVADNVDLMGSPGDVAILNTSQPGPVQYLTVVLDPNGTADNYLYAGSGGRPNFGGSPDLRVGNWGGGEWNRAVLRLPALPLPANATVRTAHLGLYMHTADTPGPMDISVHRVLASWTELGSNWDTRDGTVPWTNAGGDFDAATVDVVSVGSTTGWYRWNITALVQGWRSGAYPDDGLMLRQADDTTNAVGRKQFYSSDANESVRPRLDIAYTTPSSTATLESRIIDALAVSAWGSLWWNATVPPGTSVALETRSGSSPVVDGSWGPWSAPSGLPGSPIASPPARYLQYRLRLFTPSSTSPVVHDVGLGFGHFTPQGTVITAPFAPANLSRWGRVEAEASGPPGTRVALAYSQDNGSSWVPVPSGANLTEALPRPLLLRLTLATDNTTVTPRATRLTLGFTLRLGPEGAGPPWWLLLLLPLALLGPLAARPLLRGPFRPTDLFLIHADGRLVLHVGGRESPLRDELAASGMFTLVVRFVKDSFGGAGGASGELKSLRVDEREVVIARGEYLYLALVAKGERPPALEGNMVAFVRQLEARHRGVLEAWRGTSDGLEGLEGALRSFLHRGYRHPRWAHSDGG